MTVQVFSLKLSYIIVMIEISGINHPLPINGYTNGDLDHSKNSNYISHVQVSGPPQVPENFHVEKIVGNSSLMLAWQQLPLDNSGCNTGVKVTGYRVCVFVCSTSDF